MHGDSRGYYAALHVRPDAGPQEIRRAFRALMRQRHPDVGGAAGTPAAGDGDIGAILAAFTVLRDPAARAAYDRAEAGPPARDAGETGTSGESQARRGRVDGRPDVTSAGGGTEIPVRVRRDPEPALRIMPVRWERGPFHNTPRS